FLFLLWLSITSFRFIMIVFFFIILAIFFVRIAFIICLIVCISSFAIFFRTCGVMVSFGLPSSNNARSCAKINKFIATAVIPWHRSEERRVGREGRARGGAWAVRKAAKETGGDET